MALPALETTSPLDWRYTAEGGANLVLSFVGPRGPFTGKLLRLRKHKLAHATGFIPDEVDVEFGQRIIRPLLGDEQVVAMDRMAVSTEWLTALKHELDDAGVRPALRQLEDEVDERAGLVVLAEDLVHGEGVLAVEIKVSVRVQEDSSDISLIVTLFRATFSSRNGASSHRRPSFRLLRATSRPPTAASACTDTSRTIRKTR